MNPTPTPTTEDRAGLMLAARLDQGLQDLGPDIAERLRFARERAVARARQSRRLAAATSPAWAAPSGLVLAGAGGSLPGAWGGLDTGAPRGTGSWWTKLVSALPLLILALGFLAIQDTLAERQVQAAAEVDAALLTDDLPPQAYADPGFAEFLRRQER
ncbi:MAG: DUF3619 family protein [Burkholderiales bacterium]|nr:DUF3619 family protein [Burkholderiales bacterium]NBO76822.1 DUF3619 family protein [Betaproteobacteria bacterium]